MHTTNNPSQETLPTPSIPSCDCCDNEGESHFEKHSGGNEPEVYLCDQCVDEFEEAYQRSRMDWLASEADEEARLEAMP